MSYPKENVLLAMSGGVDSSVAAYLLRQGGYDVTGLFLRPPGRSADADDARRVAGKLDIELIDLDVEEDFARIIDYFVDEYARGRTPNPCIRCNTHIKFACLITQADELGIRYVATGHHARMIRGGTDFQSGGTGFQPVSGTDCKSMPPVGGRICRAGEKDQSYALFGIPREHLGRILFPIGDIGDKADVRRIAAELGLSVADKPDSQEICFVSGDYVDLLRSRSIAAIRPGDIVDAAGNVLGRHDGVANFTIGQRRGLRVAAGEPMYVTHIDPATATVTIGPKDEVMSRRLSACDANWHVDTNDRWHGQVEDLAVVDNNTAKLRLTAPPAGRAESARRQSPACGEFDAIVQIRYNHPGAPARVRITAPDRFEAEFTEPVAAITPGQAAVVYDGDILLGGGWIE